MKTTDKNAKATWKPNFDVWIMTSGVWLKLHDQLSILKQNLIELYDELLKRKSEQEITCDCFQAIFSSILQEVGNISIRKQIFQFWADISDLQHSIQSSTISFSLVCTGFKTSLLQSLACKSTSRRWLEKSIKLFQVNILPYQTKDDKERRTRTWKWLTIVTMASSAPNPIARVEYLYLIRYVADSIGVTPLTCMQNATEWLMKGQIDRNLLIWVTQ